MSTHRTIDAPSTADTAMDVELLVGDGAEQQLADQDFRDAWQALNERCPWGTVFQSPAYVE
ncbi:MAG TPA: hypothetical protein VGX76_14590, partial [Pirellulales bacterium]|nr:hypothetical protein [Pirellulales bacterium]